MANNLDKLTILRSLQIEIPFVITCPHALRKKDESYPWPRQEVTHLQHEDLFLHIILAYHGCIVAYHIWGKRRRHLFSKNIK